MAAPLLGLYGGPAQTGIDRIAKREKILGRAVPVQGDSYPRDTWANVLNAKTWAVPAWKASPRIKAISVPLCTEQDFPHYDLAGAATGAYDAKYAAICDGLVGVPNLILRPGWEGNGGWYPWGMNAPNASGQVVLQSSRAPLHVAAFQRFVTIARSKLPGVLISWNMACGNLGVATQNLYPGDAYVDIISMDVYNVIWDASYARSAAKNADGSPRLNPDGSQVYVNAAGAVWSAADETKRFNFLRDQTNGLAWQVTFAAAHKKLLAWDEWGSGSKPSGSGWDTSLDAPGFIQSMAAWAIAKGFFYHTYFDYPEGSDQWQVMPYTLVPGSQNPAKVFPGQAAAFLATYGVTPMANVLDDADAQCDATRLALQQADTTLLNAKAAQTASATASAAAVANAQTARDTAKATHLAAVDSYRTASAAY